MVSLLITDNPPYFNCCCVCVQGASMGEIRKQYRKLSKVYHPDKEGGDQDMFMKIAKAYEA